MNAFEASKERVRLWTELKPLLIRSLGYEGAGDWMLFAGAQLKKEGVRRSADNVIELPRAEWQP